MRSLRNRNQSSNLDVCSNNERVRSLNQRHCCSCLDCHVEKRIASNGSPGDWCGGYNDASRSVVHSLAAGAAKRQCLAGVNHVNVCDLVHMGDVADADAGGLCDGVQCVAGFDGDGMLGASAGGLWWRGGWVSFLWGKEKDDGRLTSPSTAGRAKALPERKVARTMIEESILGERLSESE